MKPDPTSLERLHDIVVPPPTPWWPPATGWLWLLGILAVLALWGSLRALAHWQRNCYRREALAALARAEALAATDPGAALRAMSELLKRTALTAYPRAQVASHTGPAWFAWLDATGGTGFANGPGALLEQAAYRPGRGEADCDAARARELAAQVRQWIRRHRPQPADGAVVAGPGNP